MNGRQLQIHHEMARRGDLSLALDQTQREFRALFYGTDARTVVVECSRQLGKSFWACTLAVETMLSAPPGSRINYACKTAKQADSVITPNMGRVCDSLPEDLRPVRKGPDYVHPLTGTKLVVFGADDLRACDRGRGPASVLNIVEEAGFIDWLEYLLDDILTPQLMTTKGRTVMVSSTSVSPAHHFIRASDAAAKVGAQIVRDFWSPGRMSRQEKEDILRNMAEERGMSVEEFTETTFFQREYLCRRVLDTELAVVPAFPKSRATVVGERPRPSHFFVHTSTDPGMEDKTGVLLAYHDFREDLLCVEWELLLDRADTARIADETSLALLRTFPELFAPPPEGETEEQLQRRLSEGLKRVKSNVVDDPQGRICADMWAYRKLSYVQARKDDRQAAVDQLNVDLRKGRIRISERGCPKLVRQLGSATYKRVGSREMTRDSEGHFDLVDAMVYLNRMVDRRLDPYPKEWETFDRSRQTAHDSTYQRWERDMASGFRFGNRPNPGKFPTINPGRRRM